MRVEVGPYECKKECDLEDVVHQNAYTHVHAEKVNGRKSYKEKQIREREAESNTREREREKRANHRNTMIKTSMTDLR